MTGYVVSINRKPYQKLPNGGYRRTVVGKVFETYDDAWKYLEANWANLIVKRPGQRRLVSASVEPLKNFMRR